MDKTQLKTLAALCTFKHALTNVPFDGAFCGIKIDVNEYNKEEMNDILRRSASLMMQNIYIGPSTAYFEPELNCNADIMRNIAEVLINRIGYERRNAKCCVIGKSPEDLNFFEKTLGIGMANAANSILQIGEIVSKAKIKRGVEGKTFMVKGIGILGTIIAEALTKLGAQCVEIIEKIL